MKIQVKMASSMWRVDNLQNISRVLCKLYIRNYLFPFYHFFCYLALSEVFF